MKQGDRVRIEGAAGIVHGRVEEIRKPEDLPGLPGEPATLAAQARAALDQDRVTRVALISYPYGRDRTRLIFAALESGGEWYDLRGRALQIERIAPAGEQPREERAS